MSDIYRQYAAWGKPLTAETKSKNPNRVLGGIRGSGTETLSVMTEDGVEQKLPSLNYVKGLEMKVQDLNEKVRMLERLVNQLSRR
jgi:hypothetical protein